MNMNFIYLLAAKALKEAKKGGGGTVETDKTLTVEDAPADAKATGEALEKLKQYLLPGLNSTWKDLAEAVGSGLAKEMVQIGDTIENNWEDTVANKVYDFPLRANHFEDVEIEGGETVPGLWLEAKYATPFGIQFGHQEAFYYAENELPAGTYNIKFGTTENNGKYVKEGDFWKFTLTKAVPVGGRIAGFYGSWDQDPKNWRVHVYAADAITVLESNVAVSAATGETDGTNLGTFSKYGNDQLNGIQQVSYGNNRYATSAIRQWLNSDKPKGQWWTPQGKYDIAPDQLSQKDGYLCGVDPELIKVMLPVKVVTYCNTVTAEGIAQVKDVTYDKVTLRSLEQMYCVPQIAGEGEAHEYYKELSGGTQFKQWATYKELIAYAAENHLSAQSVRLRSAHRGSAYNAWNVLSSGNVNGVTASSAWRGQPLVIIGKSKTISAPTDAE